ncbi:hypothetical protein IHN32_01085 [Deinococcus sp. 14RED07]|uniref:hypothetical protein n=1 Tax=unclassified Deinococcus TaxID=2623546 RepID=UPI001E4871F5|nr:MULTISPECIES: hypothetical protein [unclassified Deinococcus]MCD0164108.1 hypothetical protein [Deinococcus sp. 12RED42]MCD0174550.1 hypothetical protein [Deinococcus sp. 14RED07]
MNGIQADGGRRLCGSGRTAGELYLECGMVRGGSPIEDRLMDLPLEVDPVEMGVSAIGISTFMDEHGVTHVLDWVGADSYPEMADFIEEARRKGVSRKVSRTAPLGDLTAQSCLYLLHPRAVVTNASTLATPADFACPCGKGHTAQEGCIGLGWHVSPNAGDGQRRLADGTYPVKAPLSPAPEYALGVFMVVPITALTVIQHPDPTIQADREKRAGQSGLPVFVAQE